MTWNGGGGGGSFVLDENRNDAYLIMAAVVEEVGMVDIVIPIVTLVDLLKLWNKVDLVVELRWRSNGNGGAGGGWN